MELWNLLSLGILLSPAIAAPALLPTLSDAAKKRLIVLSNDIPTVPD